jgi:hypothetical protein
MTHRWRIHSENKSTGNVHSRAVGISSSTSILVAVDRVLSLSLQDKDAEPDPGEGRALQTLYHSATIKIPTLLLQQLYSGTRKSICYFWKEKTTVIQRIQT